MKKEFFYLISLAAFSILYALILINDIAGDYSFLLYCLFMLPLFLGLIANFLVIKKYGINNFHGKSFLLLGTGFFLFFIGEIIWAALDLSGLDPFPSTADVFYLVGYLFLFWGLLREIKYAEININNRVKIILITFFVIFGGIFSYFAIWQKLNESSYWLADLVAALYGLGDIVLILFSLFLFMAVLEYRRGKVFFCWLWMLLNFIAMLSADLIFNIFYEIFDDSLAISLSADLLWIISYGLYAISMLCFYHMLRGKEKDILRKIAN